MLQAEKRTDNVITDSACFSPLAENEDFFIIYKSWAKVLKKKGIGGGE